MPASRTRPSTSVLLLLAAALCASAPARAQSGELRPGARVRLAAPGYVADHYEGTVIAHSGDTLRVARPEGSVIAIPVARIQSLEVSRGKSHLQGALAGTRWGAIIGVPVGVLTAATIRCPSTSTHCVEPTSADRAAVGGAMVLSSMIWGASIGGGVGREAWSRYTFTPAPRASLVLDGSHVGVRMAF